MLRIPQARQHGSPAWHGENELITDVDPDSGDVVLLNGTKSLRSITRDKMVLDVAATIDDAFITGSGATGTPLGPLNDTDVQQKTAVGDLTP